MTQRSEEEGSKKGNLKWDNESDHDDVTKIYVHYSLKGIESIRFDYVKSGKPNDGSFHGESCNTYTQTIYSLGAYFTWITPTRIEAIGGKEGTKWDDGVNQAGFTKIHVRSGQKGIQFIKFEYIDKDGHLIEGPIHGSIYRRGSPHVFEINHVDKEYLVSVEGYYDGDAKNGVIQALQFRTNIRTSEFMGSNTGKKFRLAASGMKIVGFHGYAETNLNSLGAYLTPLTPTKLECQGITAGSTFWDDGAFDGIRKVSILSIYIRCLGVTYENAGKVEKRYHGMNNGDLEEEFLVDYPNEFITSVVGTKNSTRVTSLTFKTSKGRSSQTFGDRSESDSVEFVLGSNGCAIVGFHGWYKGNGSGLITALGAYYYPMPLPPAAEKIEAQGGAGGAPWDDGSNFEGVRKIYIGTGEIGILSVKFLYENDTQEIVVGDHHGNKNLLGHEEFELDYPYEYLTSVEGSNELEVILMLKFTTNMRTSPCYGLDDDPSFVLHKEGHKIVGFHGKSSSMLHQLGIHVLPITDS